MILDIDKKKLKEMDLPQLQRLCKEIREEIIEVVTLNGGHLASNLGIVELTVALNYVFDYDSDMLNFDVGHQCYANKIINGRSKQFFSLRADGGISGFPDHQENNRDSVSSGHSSTALSLSLGQMAANKINGDLGHIVAVVGDGAFTGGESFEALNNLSQIDHPLTVILNDNDMSISKNVGAMNSQFTKLRISKSYIKFKKSMTKVLSKIPLLGKAIIWISAKFRDFFRLIFTRQIIFEHFGLKYVGIIDGHDLNSLIKTLEKVKFSKQKLLLHVATKKGFGYTLAEDKPDKYHGVTKGLAVSSNYFSKFVGQELIKLATNDTRICAITAAMSVGTGLVEFSKTFPKRFFDVGIAEQHAVTFAAGLCSQGLKPYVAIYSSFLQRAYDQILIDVAINCLPIVFLVDRAGITGADGKSHQGIFDISFLNSVPNLQIFCPKDKAELTNCLSYTKNLNNPVAIRYGAAYQGELGASSEDFLNWEVLDDDDICDNVIITFSNKLLHIALEAKNKLLADDVVCSIVNARSIKPLDCAMLDSLKQCKILVLEDNVKSGSLGHSIMDYYTCKNQTINLHQMCIGDTFVAHGSIDEIYERLGFTSEKIYNYFIK